MMKVHLENLNKIEKLNYFSESNGFQEHKKEAIQILKRTICFLNKFNINHCLISGTLLGCVRHNDFIPWDDDIDLLVEDTIFEKLQNISDDFNDINILFKDKDDIIKSCFLNGKEIIDPDNWKEYSLKNKRKYCWPFIDMFTYSLKKDKIFFFIKDWNINDFLPFKKVDFLGIEVCIPKNPDYFLRSNYGNDYMTKAVSPSFSHKKERSICHTETAYLKEIEGQNAKKK